MTLTNFIFSNQPGIRLGRHLAFWLIFSLHFVIQNLIIGGPGEGKTSRTFLESFFHFLYFLPVYLLSTYVFIEVLLPNFFYHRRYLTFLFSFLALFTINFIAVYYAGVLYLHNAMNLPFEQIKFNTNKYHVIVDGLFVPFMLLGIAAGIKFSKKWLLQQSENERLAKQKLANELQLLKTSIHPRFLFHSLHTVQRHINTASAQSPTLILQLSDLLSYILYEKDENWTPLEKELGIIRYYINLEEKSFCDKTVFKTEFPEKTEDKFIVPFLLLSIIESSFEYLSDTGQEKPFFTLIIRANENTLNFQLAFSRMTDLPIDTPFSDENFLTLQKQLQDQYPGLHDLQVTPADESISIGLKLPLYSGDLIKSKKNTRRNEIPDPV